MDDRDLYWKSRVPPRGHKEEPVFHTKDIKGPHSWEANWEPEWKGPHEGKGPKNYRRSDIRILEDINDRLTMSPYVDATEILVKVDQGVVTLGGRVEQRRSKHMAEEIAERVSGVREVRNEIAVEARHHRRKLTQAERRARDEESNTPPEETPPLI